MLKVHRVLLFVFFFLHEEDSKMQPDRSRSLMEIMQNRVVLFKLLLFDHRNLSRNTTQTAVS